MYPGADSSHLRAELAVMSIFRDCGVPADVFVPIEDIARHWADYGVRAADLNGAIDRLAARHLVARRQDAPTQVARTVAGQNWFDEQPAWLLYHLLVPRISRARFQRGHAERITSGARRRRGSDQAHKRESA